MLTTIPFESSAATPPLASNRWQTIAAYLVKRRVRLTLFVFIALLLEDVIIGVRPHSLLNVRDPESMVGFALVALGFGVRSWAAGILRKSRELTTTGPYSLVRNPLYFGSFLIMGGFCTLIDDVENIYFVMGPIAGLYYLQILHEERSLARQFGPSWEEYAQRVPRLFPRRLPDASACDWHLSEWLGNREYRACVAVLAGLLAIELWHWSSSWAG